MGKEEREGRKVSESCVDDQLSWGILGAPTHWELPEEEPTEQGSEES